MKCNLPGRVFGFVQLVPADNARRQAWTCAQRGLELWDELVPNTGARAEKYLPQGGIWRYQVPAEPVSGQELLLDRVWTCPHWEQHPESTGALLESEQRD